MAVPNPENELVRLRKALARELPQVIVLAGPAAFFRGEAIDTVLAALPADAEVRSLTGEKETDGQELQDLCGASLFGRGSWLVVRRGDAWLKEHGPALLALLPRIAARCGLVVETAKIDKRTKFGKALAKPPVALFEFRALYDAPFDRSRSPLEGELVIWIGGRARARGLPLNPQASLLLMRSVGTDPAECVAEIDRLVVQVGKSKKALGPEQIAGLLSHRPESTQFELADALLDGDRRRALRSVEALFQRGLRGRDGETVDRGGLFPMITSWLYTSLANAYEGRFLLDRGVSLREVPQRLGVYKFVDRFQAQVANNPEPRLRRGLKLLLAAQRELRTGEDPQWILRRLVDRFFEGAA